MKLNGLIINKEITVKNEEKYGIAKYHELDDGTKCIKIHETQDENSPVIKEFRIGKKTKTSILWGKCNEWRNKTHHKYFEYMAPDGKVGTYNFFMKEAENGRLHGLTVTV